MSWLLWGSSQKLTGSYPGGQKLFRCTFPMSQIDTEIPRSKSQTSGDVTWIMGVINTKNEEKSKTEKLKVFVRCQLEDHMKTHAEENWHIEADHIVRLVNHTDSDKNVCARGATTFNNDKKESVSSLMDIVDLTDDFLQNDELTFEVEIGVKASEGLPKTVDFSVKTPDTNAVFTIDNNKFYVDKEILSKKSTIFKEMFSVEGTGKAKNEYPIEGVDPNVFHVFIKYVNEVPVQFSLEHIEELLKMEEKFQVSELKEKCKEFLMNAVVDDAEALKLADKFNMQDVIVEKLKPLNTIAELKVAFKYYRRFSDASMRLLLKKLIQVA